MSLLDQVGNTLSSFLSDPERAQGVLKLVMDLINNPEIGGVSGLVKTFQEKGLGDIISSWISTGQNLPISSEQIQHVLGNETIQKLIGNSGLPTENISSDLSALLPVIIDKLTPNGEIGESSLLEKGLELLKGKMLG